MKMAFYVLALCSLVMVVGCKTKRSAYQSALTAEGRQINYSSGIIFPMPHTQIPSRGLGVDDMLKLIPGVKGDIGNRPTAVSQTFDGETILWVSDEGEYFPILSIDSQDQVWIYETEVIIVPGEQDGDIRMVPTSKVTKRLPTESGVDFVEYVHFRKFANSDGMPVLSKVTDKVYFSDEVLYRVANDFVDEERTVRFKFVERAPSVWQIDGDFQGSLLCSGSVIWQDNSGWHGLTQRFDKLQYIKWTSNQDTLTFVGIEPADRAPKVVRSLVKPCSTGGYVDASSWIESIEYDPLAPIQQDGRKISKFSWGNGYPLGTLIEFDDTTWRVLESRPELGFYRVLNFGRVPQEDQGRNMQRVYELRSTSVNPHFDHFKPDLVELGRVEDFIVAAAESFDDLSMSRIREQVLSRELRETAFKKMQVAENKASIVGAGLSDEWYKPLIRIAGHAASDRMLDPNFAAGSARLFGLSPSGASIQGSITTAGVPLRTRMAAFFAYTVVDASLNVSPPVIVNMQKGDHQEAVQAIKQAFASTGVINAMRGIAAATPTKVDDGIAFVTSGFVVRWRKLRMEEAVGYENLNQVANIAAGGIQTYLQIRAVNARRSPGHIRAIGKAGLLVSEVISGRAYPGVIIGGLGEIATDLIVFHPAIRPFANTAAEQVSALAQIADAMHAHSRHGNSLEAQRQLRLSQGSLFNSVAYILKTQPEVLERISFLNQEALITVMSDPYRIIKNHYLNE